MNTTRSLSTLTTSEILSGLQAVRDVLAPELTDNELKLFAMVANRSGLDPWARQVYAVKRGGKVSYQTGIDGYRSIAERTGEYMGSDEPEFGPWADKPWGHPEWARVVVKRSGRDPQAATAYWDEFVPASNDSMWRKMPRNQLAKCAEALAFRKAFPFLLSDVYTTEEMAQADSRDAADSRAQAVASLPTVRERVAARRASAAPDPDPEPEPVEDAEAVEVPEDWRPAEAPQPSQDGPCGSVAADGGVMAGAVCTLPSGHPRAHRAGDAGTWPQ